MESYLSLKVGDHIQSKQTRFIYKVININYKAKYIKVLEIKNNSSFGYISTRNFERFYEKTITTILKNL